MIRQLIVLLSLSIFLVSCKDKPEQESDAIARINDSFIYKKDIQGLVSKGTSKEDSISIIHHHINRLATQRLLLDAAEFNLSDEKKHEIDELVEKFKIDLLTSSYLEIMVQQSIDTIVNESELVSFYEKNKENFLSKDMLVKLRYVNTSSNNPKLSKIRKSFSSNKKSDIKEIEDLSLQIKSYALNDSLWVNVEQIYTKLPFINSENKDSFLTEGNSFEVKEGADIYMVKVNKVLKKKGIYPYEYIRSELVQTLVNNRKMELIKKIQKEILDDANKNNKYEIYK